MIPDIITDLSTRLAAASGVLTTLAEKDGRVREIMRLRLALERIALLDEQATSFGFAPSTHQRIAREALGW